MMFLSAVACTHSTITFYKSSKTLSGASDQAQRKAIPTRDLPLPDSTVTPKAGYVITVFGITTRNGGCYISPDPIGIAEEK